MRGRLMVLTAFLITLPAPAARADDTEKILPHLRRVYKDDFLEIRSDVAVPNATALAVRMKEAYQFAQKAQGFTSARFNKPYTVGLASLPLARKYGYGDSGGAALGPDRFVSHVDEYPFQKKGAGSWDGGTLSTTAHEFEHSLMMRAGATEFPVYICEGICCSLGDRYSRLTPEGNDFMEHMAQLTAQCTRADAEFVVRHFRVDADFQNFKEDKLLKAEELGALFIEFLAARVVKSPAKFFRQWGSLCRKMGAGQSFRRAFRDRFGLSLTRAEEEFLKYVKETEGNPTERFRGTVYEGFGGSKKNK